MNLYPRFAFALVTIGIFSCVSCQSLTSSTAKGATTTTGGSQASQSNSDSFVNVVKTGTIRQYPYVPIGKAFDATFAKPTWTSGESEKGVKFVEFTGHFQKVALEKSRAVFHECVDPMRETAKMPNYSFIKAIGQYNVPILSSITDARSINVRGSLHSDPGWWGRYGVWKNLMQFAEQNKGNEALTAETYNNTADPRLIEFFGYIGPGNSNYERFVKEFADVSVCGAEDSHDSVRFQFQIAPDGQSFSLSYIDMAPWERIGMATESVLKYVFD